MELESHEIWKVETKWPYEQQLSPRHEVPLDFGEFLHLAAENYDFAIYNNFCFLDNFLLKSQNKVSLVLGQCLRSLVYDFAFNSIFPFLVKIDISPSNLIISVNQGFRHFLIVLGFYFLSIYMFCNCQRQIKLLSIKIQTFCQILSQVDSSLSPCGFREISRGFEVYYQKLIVQFLLHQESIICAFFRLP